MCSRRIRANVQQIFDCFLEVVPSQAENGQPWVLQTYPANYKEKEQEKLKSVPQFTFPCKCHITNVEHFSFVLTDVEAKWTFGYCRYAPNGETALVFLSSLPWHEFFYKLLNRCSELTQHKDSGELMRFLEQVHKSSPPLPGLTFHLEHSQGQVFTAPTPNFHSLPSIPENRNFTEYYSAVDVNNMMLIFASMLNERRIIVTSKKLSRLSACVQAANAVIYPMSWEHIFIPVLPVQLMDYLSAPMPFLIGVPETIMKRTRPSELGDVVVLDADNNRVDTPFDDLDSLPSEVVSNLKKGLKSPASMLGDSVARAFLQALVHLIGGYRDALKHRQGEKKIVFSEDLFIESRSASVQPFLEKMLELQIFRQFIDERLELLNSGKGFSDEFEMECVVFTEKSQKKFKNQYTTLTQSVRKESGALVKKVKSKTNPAVKDAMKNVIDGSKIAKDRVKDGGKLARTKAKATFKDVKLRLRESKDEIRDDSSSAHSAPSSPVQSRSSTINRYGTISNAPFPRQHTDLGFGRVLKYERFDPSNELDNMSPEFEDLPKLDIDIMNDIDEIMKRNQIGRAQRTSDTRKPDVRSVDSARKSSVGDLINLDNDIDAESIDFDPFASSSASPTNTGDSTNLPRIHRKLSRTYNPHSAVVGTGPAHPAGKLSVDNYAASGPVPSHSGQAVGWPNDQRKGMARSSDDLLREYGLNFTKLNLHSSQTSTPSLLQYQSSKTHANVPLAQAPPQYNTSNGCISGPTYTRPSFQTNGGSSSAGRGGSGSLAPTPMPPPRVSGSSRPNTSFLYDSSANTVTNHHTLPANCTVMPVNQRLDSASRLPCRSGSTGVATAATSSIPSCKDILADLDPLRKPSLERTTGGQSQPSQLTQVGITGAPPAIPPRSKKQWTTFE